MITADTLSVDYSDRAIYYEVEYDEAVDHDFYRALIAEGAESVLEIPCGTGRNALVLAGEGKPYTAADIEPCMVERLRGRAAEHGIINIEACVADMRRIGLNRQFDLIFSPREAFQLIPDKEGAIEALHSMKAHLSPGGTLIIDLSLFAKDPSEDPAVHPDYFDPELPMGEMIAEWTRGLPDGSKLKRARVQTVDEAAANIHYHYERWNNGGLSRNWNSKITLSLYAFDEFEQMAATAGLRAIAVYRDYKFTPYEAGSSRMVFRLTHA
ncbi:class I SAM-dependent methyltransferase [Leisingera sp. S232]|uniref:class I SAM-dependent methyltransferase n=1 Tax=Leisingera sp. S232 TaxID=3415132 RepID=UPI003C7AA363